MHMIYDTFYRDYVYRSVYIYLNVDVSISSENKLLPNVGKKLSWLRFINVWFVYSTINVNARESDRKETQNRLKTFSIDFLLKLYWYMSKKCTSAGLNILLKQYTSQLGFVCGHPACAGPVLGLVHAGYPLPNVWAYSAVAYLS